MPRRRRCFEGGPFRGLPSCSSHRSNEKLVNYQSIGIHPWRLYIGDPGHFVQAALRPTAKDTTRDSFHGNSE